MRVLVAGLGSIGRRHLANLKRLEPDASITVWRQHAKPADASPAPPDREVYSLEAALAARPEAALITGPATTHIETARALASAGVHLMIEKPLSHSLDGVDGLIDQCRRDGLVLLVGYSLRFRRSLQALKRALDAGQIGRLLSARAEVGQYLPDWRPGADYRTGVSGRSDLGGGALLELSHEIDYLGWLAGDVASVFARTSRLSDLDIDVEDAAEIILEFTAGAIGSVHLDMVQRSPTRTCRLIGTEGTLVWDGIADRVTLYSAATGAWTDIHDEPAHDRNEMYLAELRHFLDCVRGDAVPAVGGAEARRVLAITLAARQASMERRAVFV